MTGKRSLAWRALKALERWVRGTGVRLVAWAWASGDARFALPPSRSLRVLVIRLDPRLGNVLMTTPLLSSLRARFADAAIDVLVHPYAARVLAGHPDGVRLLPLRRLSVWGPEGLLRRLWSLRRQRYDVCIDATNPTHPSATQAWLSRLSGAACRIGYDVAPVSPLYTRRVSCAPHEPERWHEIERRLALLTPLGDGELVRHMSVGPLAEAARPAMRAFLHAMRGRPLCVINLGARASARRVSAADGAAIANLCTSLGLCPVLVAGREDGELCADVARLSLDAIEAPDASVADLALLFGHASVFVTGDTGPMHLAVALGCPTLGLFLVTCPRRYGYEFGPHEVIDARGMSCEAWLPRLRSYLSEHRYAPAPLGAPHPSHPLRAAGPALHHARTTSRSIFSTHGLS